MDRGGPVEPQHGSPGGAGGYGKEERIDRSGRVQTQKSPARCRAFLLASYYVGLLLLCCLLGGLLGRLLLRRFLGCLLSRLLRRLLLCCFLYCQLSTSLRGFTTCTLFTGCLFGCLTAAAGAAPPLRGRFALALLGCFFGCCFFSGSFLCSCLGRCLLGGGVRGRCLF